MEAHKERREQMEKEEKKNATTGGHGGVADPVVKAVIRGCIISDDKGHDDKGGHGGGAQHPDDVLAFSRCVHKIDSSLE